MMALTRSQRKYLKKNIKRFSLAKIAADLDVPEEKILKFLKSRWRKEKYQKFLARAKEHPRGVSPRIIEGPLHLGGGKWFKQNWKVLALLAFLVSTVYLNSLGNDFVSDDIATIKDNSEIGKISYFWRPPYFILNLRSLVLFLIYKIFGLNPAFYRLQNILFHLGSSWIIFVLISLFFKSPIPLITASIFAVHPILTEAVSWISGGSYVNAAFFVLLSFLTYIWSANNKRVWFYLVSVFLFFLALLFSEKLIVFPLILLLYEFSFERLKSNWPKLLPFWAISGFWTLHLFGLLGERVTALETTYYQEPGLENPLIQIPIAVTSYLKLLFWPKNLTLYHSEMSFSQVEYFLRLGVFVLFLAAIVYFATAKQRAKRVGFFKKDRRISFWLSFFLISLLPTLTPLRISWVVAERYVYLGALGIFVIAALMIQKIGEVSKNQKISWVLLLIVLLALAARTIVRNADWKNQDALWLATAKTSPSSPQNHNNLGDLYARRGNLEKAAEEFKKAIELKPNYGDAYHNLANTYQQMGKTAEAIENFQKTLIFNPNFWQSHQNLAAIYFSQEKFDLAKQELEKAIKANLQNANLYVNLGIVYLKLNEKEKAKEEFQNALEINPNDQKAKQLLLTLP